jgi:hypothetical protein
MSAPGLKRLTIEHLRGSVAPFTLPFEKNKKLTVVYGENGTGKSTICDAFEFLGKGNVGSLDNRGLGKTTKYWQSIGKKASDVSVTLEDMDNTLCKACIVKSNVVVLPEANRPRVEVLRRSQILSLIEATAANRYVAIRRFIDVSGVEASEDSLRQLIRDLTGNRNVAIARVQENQDSIGQFWETAGKSGNDSLAWAETESKRDMETSNAEAKALNGLQAAYARLLEYPGRFEAAAETVRLAKEALVLAQSKSTECLQTISSDAGEMMGVLESAKNYLTRHPSIETCPLCESSENIDGLDQRISQRLAAFAALQSAQVETRTAGDKVQRAEQQLETYRTAYKEHAEVFEQERATATLPTNIDFPASSAPEKIEDLVSWLANTSMLPDLWKKAETERLDKKQFIGTLKSALKTYQDNVQAQKELDVLIPKLNRALEIAEEERRNFTDTILQRIAGDVGRLYELVHPGEGLNKISLVLDPEKRASLEIGSDFGGQSGLPPQAYFSDSHLDTLGLCIFLALAALDGPDNTILVLDDVLASVDEPHVDRLIEMLYSEAIKFRHCVITTHYRPWKHKLQWGWLKNGQCQFVELAKWSNLNGLTMIRTLPDVERLEQLLNEPSPDPQLVCSKAGFILEAALNFLTLLYECAVPRKPEDRYTIGDLLPNIKGKLRENMRVDILQMEDDGTKTYRTESLTPVFNELTRIAEARNVFGCHFKAISFELLEADALPFGRQVFNLMQILVDPEEGWPKNSKSGEYWATSNETRRLYPLRKPS